MVDVNSVDKEVLSNVVGKVCWVCELSKHSLELQNLLDVFWLGADLNGGGHGNEGTSDILESLGNTAGVLLLEVGNSILNVDDNGFTIFDAGNVVIEILSLKSTK